MNPKYLLSTIMMPYVKSLVMQSSYINNTMRGIGLRNIRKFSALRMPDFDKYNNKKQVKNIYKTNNDCPSPSSENDDDFIFLEKQKRQWLMKKNKMTHMVQGSIPCAFCEGKGYVECEACEQEGCWRCDHTGYEKCPFCNTNGGGRLSYVTITPYNPPIDI